MAGKQFGVVDLTKAGSPLQTFTAAETFDVDELRIQLEAIRDSLSPIVEDQAESGLGLQKLEVALSISLEGRVWFVAKGAAEASITLTFGRGES